MINEKLFLQDQKINKRFNHFGRMSLVSMGTQIIEILDILE